MKSQGRSSATFRTHASNFRTDSLNGREYIVSPVVAIVSGVLNGEFVPIAEIADGFMSWNGRPVTLDHPNNDGAYVSANAPEIWEQFVVGQLFNVAFATDRLKGEIWIDPELAAKTVDGAELLQRLQAGDPIEVSTAYFRNVDPMVGEFNGIPYKRVAKDLKPDHLAILLHTAGACSWADGCGVPRLNQRENGGEATMPYENEHAARLKDPDQFDEFRREDGKFGEGIDAIWGLKTNGETTATLQAIRFDKKKFTPDEAKAWLSEHGYDPVEFEPAANEAPDATNEATDQEQVSYTWWERFKEGIRSGLFGAAQDEPSLEETWDAVVSAFYTLIESGQPVGEVGDGYVVKVYPEHIIVERADGKLFQVDYSTGDSGVEFGDQVEVKMVYQPVGNQDAEPLETQMATEDESDPEAEPMEPVQNEGETEPEPESEMTQEPDPELETNEQEPEAEQAPETNETKCEKYVALVEFADSLGGPEAALLMLQATVQANADQRNALIKRLTANEACAFDREDLDAMTDDALKKLELSLEAPRANYSGQLEPAGPVPEDRPKRRAIKLPPLDGNIYQQQ